MPQPTQNTAVSRPDLAVVVSEFRETAVTAAIGARVMPYLPMIEQSAEYPVIPKEVMLKIHETRRAMRGKYPSSDWEFEMGFYATRENGWEEKIDDRERKLYATLLDAEMVATRRATKIIDLSTEKRIAAKVFNPSNFAPHNVSTPWDVPASATPIDDFNDANLALRAQCGMPGNTLIIGFYTFTKVKNCDQIVDRLMYTFPGIDINSMTTQQLAAVLNVPRVLVGGAIYDSADKGQDAEIADLWSSDYAMLTICSDSPDVSEPCIGRSMIWTEESPGSGEPVVESYRAEGNRSDVVRVRHDSDERLLKSYDEDGNVQSDIAAAVSYLMGNIKTT
ncbi:hypothetical protein [uncultured Desulfosarcina sp.]|uniref:hypothetical protein n=1 Tax=uncultured Desulfosarcina sp. TaxID=218289 RepID=UPI0029C9464C|nr:hypothetical protein [uncultured Desulfosarcina sp.]